MKKEKAERLCDSLYDSIVARLKSHASGYEKVPAWVITWHLREDWGYKTSELNYHLNKLVKEGKMLKQVSKQKYWTKFSPVTLEGFYREGDYFYHNKTN